MLIGQKNGPQVHEVGPGRVRPAEMGAASSALPGKEVTRFLRAAGNSPRIANSVSPPRAVYEDMFVLANVRGPFGFSFVLLFDCAVSTLCL